ncbi:hypothetical protein Plhal304r1_c035g0109161 [Plasmopara halstedii]
MLYISSKVGFPLPFLEQIGSVVLTIYIPIVVLLVLGTSPFTKNSECRPYFRRFQRFQLAYLTLAIIYPYYKALYDFTPSPYRTFTVIMLPIWKFGSKYLVFYCGSVQFTFHICQHVKCWIFALICIIHCCRFGTHISGISRTSGQCIFGSAITKSATNVSRLSAANVIV